MTRKDFTSPNLQQALYFSNIVFAFLFGKSASYIFDQHEVKQAEKRQFNHQHHIFDNPKRQR